MTSLLPGCVIPETMKTSMILAKMNGDDICGVFSNFNTSENFIFNSSMELLFEVDSMLASYLNSIANKSLDEFSFNSFKKMSNKLVSVAEEYAAGMNSFYIKIWFARNSQWKGSIEWLEGNVTSEFKTTSELISFLIAVLGDSTCEISTVSKTDILTNNFKGV